MRLPEPTWRDGPRNAPKWSSGWFLGPLGGPGLGSEVLVTVRMVTNTSKELDYIHIYINSLDSATENMFCLVVLFLFCWLRPRMGGSGDPFLYIYIITSLE